MPGKNTHKLSSEDDLRAFDTFKDLSDDDFSALCGICSEARFPPGCVLAREGYSARSLFALVKGTVGIWVDYGTDSADLLTFREAPCLVGEMSVADCLPRSATIVTAEQVSGYRIEAAAFRALLEERGRMAMALMKSISRLVRASNDSFVRELRNRNERLIQANKDLRNAHKRLVKQERLSSLGKFSSMIIHDLRNPLSVIKGYADILELRLQSSDYIKYIDHIKREAARLSALAGEWLDYSRGEIHLNYTPVTIPGLFEQLKADVESRMSAKDLKVSWEVSFTGIVMLDADRMIRVMLNLCENARRACSRGDSVKITAFSSDGYLFLRVRDTGAGMSRETLNHIFDPFYTASGRGGTGLGMHIVKTVVEAHEGTVEVTSTLDKGTEITLGIPVRL